MSRPITLQAAPRERSGSAVSRRLRREGVIPAVVYGARQTSAPIQVINADFAEILRHQSSQNFLVNLEIEGAEEKTKLAIVQEIQRNPITGQIVHVDFHAVREDETVHATVPVELVGDAAGVKLGGRLEHLIHSLDIECLPGNLPDKIVHDVSGLAIGDAITIGDLALPEGVTAGMDPDVLVASLVELRTAAQEDLDAAESPAEIEGAGAEGESAAS